MEGNVFLIGFMGTGKSTIASVFSKKYAMKLTEMDDTIAKGEGKSIPDIFAQYGEEYFRNLETKFLEELKREDNVIVSCGGGVVLREENILLMKENGVIVLLTASPQEILKRVENDNERPLLQGRKNVSSIMGLMEERREKYERAADIVISTDGKMAEVICEELMNELKRAKER